MLFGAGKICKSTEEETLFQEIKEDIMKVGGKNKMKYREKVVLKNGQDCIIRNATYEDGPEMADLFVLAHSESDYLLSYPEEHNFDVKCESEFLQKRAESDNEVMLLAVVNDKTVATAGISAVGNKYKVRHRAEFGIDVIKEYWGLGIGKSIMKACVQCARNAGYKQLELEAVADNKRAINMYQSIGFVEFGRNPLGFISRYSGPQELVYMRMVL